MLHAIDCKKCLICGWPKSNYKEYVYIYKYFAMFTFLLCMFYFYINRRNSEWVYNIP